MSESFPPMPKQIPPFRVPPPGRPDIPCPQPIIINDSPPPRNTIIGRDAPIPWVLWSGIVVVIVLVAWASPFPPDGKYIALRGKVRDALTLLPRYSERVDADGTHNLEWDPNGPYLRYDDLQGWLGAE